MFSVRSEDNPNIKNLSFRKLGYYIKQKNDFFLLAFLICIYSLVFGVLSLLRHYSLHSTYFDLGYETQSIWTATKGRLLEVSFGPHNEMVSSFATHVNPILFLLVPFYSLWPSPEWLLVFQSLLLGLGAVPLFLLTLKKTSSRLLAYGLAVSYLLYPPIQYANLFDFHPVTLSTTLLLFTFYFGFTKNKLLFLIVGLLSALSHEEVPLLVGLLGLYFAIANRWKYLGGGVFGLGLAWFWVNISLVMPYFARGTSVGLELSRFSEFGKNPSEIVTNFFLNPQIAVRSLLIRQKMVYLFHLFVSAGFLSLLAPWSLVPALPAFIINLFSNHNPMYQVKFHYTSTITPFIFVSAVYGANLLLRRIPSKVLVLYLVSISLIYNILHSPSPLFYKFNASSYQITDETRRTLELLKTIPPDASVSAMNNLGAHLANREKIFVFPNYLDKADYVVVDPEAVAENYDLSQIKKEDYEEKVERLRNNPNYLLKVQDRHLLIFERIG